MDKISIYNDAYSLLKEIYGVNSTFREGQYEAIEATLLYRRTLVVQTTGWGKSLVYFMCTKMFRKLNKGVTFVVSPLLVLMENQLEAAQKMGLVCHSLNSTTKEHHEEIISEIKADKIDLVFITPETLFSNKVQDALKEINIGLFVVDEAHCISDWGHDFRLQYGNLYKVLNLLSENVPVLATTATANDRVVDDLKRQLGNKVFVSRGSLMRDSLSIQVLKLTDTASRYAWILENIDKLNGSGIIYCLTQRDCDYLTKFLKQNHINAKSYYSRSNEDEYLNTEAEDDFLNNKIKVIVATIKLGMGYDKGDIAFVIHFQQPSNIVSYYQQIGRAGRNIPRAYTFLMTGSEDEEIQNYFIETAFPKKEEYDEILNFIFENTDNGVTLGSIIANVNIRKGRIDKVLMFLENDGYITKDKGKYYSTIKEFVYDYKKYNEITQMRKKEQSLMTELSNTRECYNRFIVNCLDDKTTKSCGICESCLGYEEFSSKVNDIYLQKALTYLDRLLIPILPRKQWTTTNITRQTKINVINQEGICLSKYGEAGYGRLVKNDKYSKNDRFCDELVGKTVSVLKSFIKENNVTAITFVPSLRNNMVCDFAKRVAERCNVPCLDLILKTPACQQKTMQNSSHQCENAKKSFHIIENVVIPENIILIDDIIDSKWTITVCGDLLTSNGAIKVFPFALADSSNNKE